MAKYKIKHTSIMHNGHLYHEGSTVELTEEQAKRLEDFVTLVPEKKQTETKSENKQKSQTNAKTSAKAKNADKTQSKTEIKEGEKNDNK